MATTSFLHQQKTLNMVAGNGYVISLTNPAACVSLQARAACHVAMSGASSAPSAPTGTPAPAPGAQSSYYDLQANEEIEFGEDAADSALPGVGTIRHILVWAIGSGNLCVAAH